jgi:hypothetical protein
LLTKTPAFGGLISLDFLGFSREKRDLSMVYTRFPLEIFSARFCRREGPSKRRPTIRHAKRTDCSWGKLTSTSDFLQEIAGLL